MTYFEVLVKSLEIRTISRIFIVPRNSKPTLEIYTVLAILHVFARQKCHGFLIYLLCIFRKQCQPCNSNRKCTQPVRVHNSWTLECMKKKCYKLLTIFFYCFFKVSYCIWRQPWWNFIYKFSTYICFEQFVCESTTLLYMWIEQLLFLQIYARQQATSVHVLHTGNLLHGTVWRNWWPSNVNIKRSFLFCCQFIDYSHWIF